MQQDQKSKPPPPAASAAVAPQDDHPSADVAVAHLLLSAVDHALAPVCKPFE